jgi:hypothetical protein
MNSNQCCNHNCNQGRDCPLRKTELTDKEITEIFDTTFEVRDYQDSFIKFARAILRKAQEK